MFQLGLGTVQFGLAYGISNHAGQTPVHDVRDILHFAEQNGMTLLDTAANYGQSEAILGALHASRSFHIVSKVPTVGASIQDASVIRETVLASLKRLRCSSLYGVLLHAPEDLLGSARDAVYAALKTLQLKGLVQKIGVSCYTQAEIVSITDQFELDILQVPVNVLDQRLVRTGVLDQLKSKGIEVHTRSAFLQGLILMSPNDLSDYFDPIKPHLKRCQAVMQSYNISPLACALGFLKTLTAIDRVIVGVNTLAQLEAIHSAMQATLPDLDYTAFAMDDPQRLDPRFWNKEPVT